MIEALYRERARIDEVIRDYERFRRSLSQLPPEVAQRLEKTSASGKDRPSRADKAGDEQATYFDRIAIYLRSQGNQRKSVNEIQNATGIPRSSIGFILYRSHKNKFIKSKDPKYSHRMLWKLKESAKSSV